MLECSICKTVFKDEEIAEYAAHVAKCSKEALRKQNEQNLKKINEKLEDLKRAKICYEGLRDDFKEKYPDVYKANFSDECSCGGNCTCGKDDKEKDKEKDKTVEEKSDRSKSVKSDKTTSSREEFDPIDFLNFLNAIMSGK